MDSSHKDDQLKLPQLLLGDGGCKLEQWLLQPTHTEWITWSILASLFAVRVWHYHPSCLGICRKSVGYSVAKSLSCHSHSFRWQKAFLRCPSTENPSDWVWIATTQDPRKLYLHILTRLWTVESWSSMGIVIHHPSNAWSWSGLHPRSRLECKSLFGSAWKFQSEALLVVSIPLKNMKVTWDDDIPNLWENNPVMFQENHQPDN